MQVSVPAEGVKIHLEGHSREKGFTSMFFFARYSEGLEKTVIASLFLSGLHPGTIFLWKK